LKQLKRTGAKGAKGLVEELDPDAILRGGGNAEGARYEADDAVSFSMIFFALSHLAYPEPAT